MQARWSQTIPRCIVTDGTLLTALITGVTGGGVLVLVRAYRAWRSGTITDNRSLIGDYEGDATKQRERAIRAEREAAQWRDQAYHYRVLLIGADVAPKDDPIMTRDLT